MKKLLFVLAAMVAFCFSAKADHDQVITFNQLPQQAQTLLKKHFAEKVPLIVTMDWDDYTVVYESGEKVEFDKQGNWKEFNCKTSKVPTALIPEQIKAHVHATFPGTTILKLDRNLRGYEVKLNNGLEIEYSRTFQVVDIDD
ncbi:MAG: PepSY-like domain-containing protein [Muribaculaceae bacterium]|nr:PepSY-like domain-containing protein [Muribaculaceae bacterium]